MEKGEGMMQIDVMNCNVPCTQKICLSLWTKISKHDFSAARCSASAQLSAQVLSSAQSYFKPSKAPCLASTLSLCHWVSARHFDLDLTFLLEKQILNPFLKTNKRNWYFFYFFYFISYLNFFWAIFSNSFMWKVVEFSINYWKMSICNSR